MQSQTLTLSASQNAFINQLNTKFRAFVGGFGSGKTFVGCIDNLIFMGQNPSTKGLTTVQAYYGPTYPSIRDIYYPTYEEAAFLMGFKVDIKESNKEVHLYRNGRYYGTTICRSMDSPHTIIGYKNARSQVDELDTLNKVKADIAWRNIVARLRLVIDGIENNVGVTTTPEGFKKVYDMFGRDPSASYSMVQASTYENEQYLPDDYISSLLESYPEHLIGPYLEGEFANLTSGQVYRNYDRNKHNTNERIEGSEMLYIGQDFNVEDMASTIYVRRGPNEREWHAVAELSKVLDTPALIETVGAIYPHNPITMYPDASGNSRKTIKASTSDIAMLKDAGFKVKAKKSNPAVKDRITSVNNALEKGLMFVNHRACPNTAECLEQQIYDKGEPDKSQGKDHQNDATGYPIAFEMPVKRKRIITPSRYRSAA